YCCAAARGEIKGVEMMEGSGRITRVFALAGAVLASTAGLAITTGHSARAASSAQVFGEPTPSGIVGDGFEEDLQLDNTSNQEVVYSSAPVGLGSSSVIWRSLDAGKTFKYVPSQIP